MGKRITIKIDEKHRSNLDRLVAELGGSSYAGLVKDLVEGKLQTRPFPASAQCALRSAIAQMIIAGDITEATMLAGGLYPYLTEPIATQVRAMAKPEIQSLSGLIRDQIPFILFYTNGAGDTQEYPCLGASWKIFDGKAYLIGRLATESQKETIEALRFNYSFNIDRISAVQPLSHWQWQEVDTIEVIFDLKGNLSRTYTPSPGDKSEWLELERLRVTRSISSSFWFLKQILSYGASAEIVDPSEMQFAIKSLLKESLSQYEKY